MTEADQIEVARELAERGVALPLKAGEGHGVIADANGKDVAVIDVRWNDAEATALARALAAAVNAAAGFTGELPEVAP